MRSWLPALILFAFVSRVFSACETDTGSTSLSGRPNIILILTDDMDRGLIQYMPNVQNLLMKQGTTFKNYFVNVPNCCPSRASLLRGQYAHNTGILANSPPNGGFARFRELGLEDSNIATWLNKAGYHTAIFGKYMNGYPNGQQRSYIPPGWDQWYVALTGLYFNYTLNENGHPVRYTNNPLDYETDVFARKATEVIEKNVHRTPFFIYLAIRAPHSLAPQRPSVPAPRHKNAHKNLRAPRTLAFNEADVSDKPSKIRQLSPLNTEDMKTIDEWYRARVLSMLAVDDMVLTILNTLTKVNALQSTYIFFTSDNGFQLGEHRIRIGKNRPYDESTNVPLIVRGPGVCKGKLTPRIAQNIDLAPTLTELAGVRTPHFVDGDSLVRIFKKQTSSAPFPWKQDALIENWSTTDPIERPGYRALRSKEYLYVEHQNGETELYDVKTDPLQLQSIHHTAPPDLLLQLSTRLKTISD